MKKRSVFLIPALVISSFLIASPVVAATTPTPTPSVNTAVIDAELKRERDLTNALSLNLPEQTEDPMYPVTFVDPSPAKEGVEITVDDKVTPKAPNPFLLPNLAIGSHKVIFKFKDSTGVKILSKTLLIVPKAPVFDATIKTQVVRPSSVSLSGTALPQSTVLLIINGTQTFKVSSTPDGKWEFIIPEPQSGTNTVLAFTVRNGIVSTASKPLTITYALSDEAAAAANTVTAAKNQFVEFFTSMISNIDATRREQPLIFYGSIGGAVVIIAILFFLALKKKAAQKRDDKTIAALFGTLQKDGGTIVDVIKDKKDKNEAPVPEEKVVPAKLKKALEELKDEIEDNPEEKEEKKETPETKKEAPEPTAPATVVITTKKEKEQPVITLKKKKDSKPSVEVKEEPKATKEEVKEIVIEKIEKSEKDETKVVVEQPKDEKVEEEVESPDEPEKKVLSKEEFLKQFQKRAEQDAE